MRAPELLKDALAKIRLARPMVKLPESIDSLKAASAAIARVVDIEMEAAKQKGFKPEGIVGMQ